MLGVKAWLSHVIISASVSMGSTSPNIHVYQNSASITGNIGNALFCPDGSATQITIDDCSSMDNTIITSVGGCADENVFCV